MQLTLVLALLNIVLVADLRIWNFGEPVFKISGRLDMRGKQLIHGLPLVSSTGVIGLQRSSTWGMHGHMGLFE